VLFCIILAAFAEFERDLIRERTKDGLAASTG
jgi:DNA invertase Pin-like site-specific DNA recombinase